MPSRDRSCKPGLAGILLLALSCSTALAADFRGVAPALAPARGAYVSVFGGGGANIMDFTQLGTVFFIEAQGGPMSVNATGRGKTAGVGFVGLQVGHEWSYGASLLPAFEIEGLYLAGTQRATLNNPTDRLPEHTFDNSFPMRNAVLLANFVLGFRTSYPSVTPYVGVGVGAARVAVHGANSAQIDPPEAGINHFNSGTDSSAWTFAAQAKAGVRFALGNSAYVFGEYRYLYIGATDQIFGPTTYPTHAPTSAWTVRFGDMSNHLGAAGIGFRF